jgi:serine/threonine-protein kinase TTK/MPS1
MESGGKLSFDIPSLRIPPLPSSNEAGKENNSEVMKVKSRTDITKNSKNPKSSPLQEVKKSSAQPLRLRTPQTMNSKSQNRPEKLLLSSSPIPPARSSTKQTPNKTRSVLRYGETVESLFCLSKTSSEQHRQLCKSIIEGSLADTPSTWRKVLEFASEGNTSTASDLIRLHRRTIIRFPVEMMHGETQSDVLAIWLSFAQAHAKHGSIEEARRTFRHLENQSVPLDAVFFLQLADMERNYDRSRVQDILQRGIKKNAAPIAQLQEALRKWRTSRSSGNTKENDSSLPSLTPTGDRLSGSPKRESSSCNQDGPSKRLKMEGGSTLRTSMVQLEKTPEADVGWQSSGSKSKAEPSLVNPGLLKSAGKSRQKLPPKRLSRKGLTGRATRVDPKNNISMANGSESEPETDSILKTAKLVEPSTRAVDHTDASKTEKVMIKKVDLSYMWEWDPNSRQEVQNSKQDYTQTQKIDEESTGNPSTNATHSTRSTASSAVSAGDRSNQSTGEKEKLNETPDSGSNNVVDEGREPIVDEGREAIPQNDFLAGVNRQFLPLVHQANILQVNSNSYAKLGVIGKGGSCKVYRALSKKCAVVAIKKVKLDGMDRNAIEGYANEISLLKRLRGNPAIIQMYDSEVDIKRKSIFLVMELGEVDLNHVLRQRALSGTCRSLNTNFIRLTWQQMLSAVHCIHEERIIHSDLKPANFLFVRGALKLIDFGIAKAIQSDDTTNIYRESHIGTLNYMSPEAILDTGSGDNGPRMKIGRVRFNRISLQSIDVLSLIKRFFCRLLMFGLLVAFSMKWCMERPRLHNFTSFRNCKPSSTQIMKSPFPMILTKQPSIQSNNASNGTLTRDHQSWGRMACLMNIDFYTVGRVENSDCILARRVIDSYIREF